jgi:hypothetical protein
MDPSFKLKFMRYHLTLPQLKAFIRVAALGNFRAAAQSLFVSQPALSRTIRIAENWVGSQLFGRETHHVTLHSSVSGKGWNSSFRMPRHCPC